MLDDLAVRMVIAVDVLFTLHIHDLRVSGRTARDFEESARIKAEPFGEHQPLGQRRAVEPEDQINRQLGLGAIADRAGEIAFRTDRIEYVAAGLECSALAADETDAIALHDLLAGAGDRHFEQRHAFRRDTPRERRHFVRVAGRHVQHDARSTGHRIEHTALGLDDIRKLFGIEHRADDARTNTRDLADRCHRAAAQRSKRLAACGIDVKPGDLEPCAKQALCQRGADQPQSNQTHIFFFAHGNTRFRRSMAECGL